MPISISKDSILFSRYKGKGYHSLIKLVNGKEQILADNIIIDYELEGLGFDFTDIQILKRNRYIFE